MAFNSRQTGAATRRLMFSSATEARAYRAALADPATARIAADVRAWADGEEARHEEWRHYVQSLGHKVSAPTITRRPSPAAPAAPRQDFLDGLRFLNSALAHYKLARWPQRGQKSAAVPYYRGVMQSALRAAAEQVGVPAQLPNGMTAMIQPIAEQLAPGTGMDADELAALIIGWLRDGLAQLQQGVDLPAGESGGVRIR